MKNTILLFAVLVSFACKKHHDDPKPVIDYGTDSLVGTYVGDYKYYNSSSILTNSNSSLTITVTKVGTNQIRILGMPEGGFDATLSDGGSGKIKIDPTQPAASSGYINTYTNSTKVLDFIVNVGVSVKGQERFTGTKQ